MTESKIQLSVKLLVQIEREGDLYISSCPALDVHSQGDSEDEARRNIIEAVQLFLESCYERGVLEQVLKESGFHPDLSTELTEDDGKVVEIPFPLLATNQGKNRARTQAG